MTKKLNLPALFLALFALSPAYAAERAEMLHDVDHPWAFTPAYANRQDWEKRAEELRQQILVSEGLWPMPERTPLNAVVHGKIERDGYTIEKVYFASMPGHYVSGNLYRPTGKTGKLPAVLFAHGHWNGGRFYENTDAAAKREIQLGAEKWMEGGKYLLQAPCAMLARLGCVVFQYDMVGYADSTAIVHREGFTDAEAALRLQSFMGLQSWNSLRSLDFLAGLPDVDPARIAMTGASGGGTQTMVLCGIDPRPAVSFPAVMVSTAMQGGCICENSYYLRLHTNNAEIAALFAPKPEGMTSANDWTKDLETKGFPEIKSVYALYNAQNDVMAWHRSFEHNYNQVSRELMYNWLNKYLKLGFEGTITEKQFVPVPPKELSVYDADHLRPGDSLDAMAVRAKMTAAANAQIAELAKKPEDYRKVVGTALRVMLNLSVERAGNIEDSTHIGMATPLPGQSITGVAHVPTTGADISYAMLKPNDWNGTVTIWLDPAGKGIFGRPDAQDTVRRLLAQKTAVVAADVFMTGTTNATNPLTRAGKYAGYAFSGYYYGYNTSVAGARIEDVLTLVKSMTAGWDVKSYNLMATGKAGPWALLLRAANTSDFRRTAIDLNHFDFDQIRDPADEMMLPGALKYGGILGFATLCTSGQTALWNPPASAHQTLPVATDGISFQNGDASAKAMVDWLVGG